MYHRPVSWQAEGAGDLPYFAAFRAGILRNRNRRRTVMSASAISISETSQRILHELSERTGRTPADIIDSALIAYRRREFFHQLDEGYAALKADPDAAAALDAEQRLWD